MFNVQVDQDAECKSKYDFQKTYEPFRTDVQKVKMIYDLLSESSVSFNNFPNYIYASVIF